MKNTINEEKKWKVLRSEYLFRRPWLTARRDEVELAEGQVLQAMMVAPLWKYFYLRDKK